MSFTTLTTTQNAFLESHLRGTSRSLTARQASATYGIQNLSARMSEFRQAGLQVNRTINAAGRTAYSVSSRNIIGSRAARFA